MSVFDGHHWMHALKMLAFMTPDGLTSILFAPFEGTCTDLMAFTQVDAEAVLHSLFAPINAGMPADRRVFAFADSIFPLSDIVQLRFPGHRMH